MRDFQRYLSGSGKQRPNRPKELTRHQRLMQHKDRLLAEGVADRLKLSLEGFLTNDALELYFNIHRDNENICYISKGWGDPGFRLGELIEIDRSTPNFKDTFYKVLNACSDNLISTKVIDLENKKIGLDLQIGLYQDGFNERVLSEAINSLQDSVGRIRRLLDR